MAQYHIRLFGRVEIRFGDQASIPFTSHKEEELFCYLLVKRKRAHSREIVASLLWGETTTARSKKYLRTALWHLRTDLDAGESAVPLIAVDDGWIQLNPHAEVWMDIHVLEHLASRVSGRAGAQLDVEEADALRAAVALYHGLLLEGWYHDWCMFERERLRQTYFGLVDKLMAYCEAHCEFAEGIALGLRMLDEEAVRESTYRRLMRFYYLASTR